MVLPLGWQTDLAVLQHAGAVVEEHPDHLVVRTPDNPTFHWGHFVLVTDPVAVDDADRWLEVFATAFPEASHRAIGLVRDPVDAAWAAAGLAVTRAPVLITTEALAVAPLPTGYDVRPLRTEADWEQSHALRMAAYPDSPGFARRTTATRVAQQAQGRITWFGAFAATGELAAELGILDCGDGTARFQSVLTHPEHRRRGLVSHLLTVADEHAREVYGTSTTVIIADEDSAAVRVYRTVGLHEDSPKVQAYLFG